MSAEQVFQLLGQGLAADPSVSAKVNGVFLFKIGDKEWTVDLKSTPGKVANGKQGTPDVTITVAESDFVSLMTGKATGQTLFMGGKLKIQGNMGLAMKLDKLPKTKPEQLAGGSAPAPAAAPSAAPAKSGSSDSSATSKVFEELGKVIAANPALVEQVGGVYQFNVTKDGKVSHWHVDLKNGKGSVGQGAPAKADCTLSTDEDSFVGMMTGKLNSQQLFMQGKLKIQGNMGLAMKLNKLQQAKAKL